MNCVQILIKRIGSELKALKAATPLNFGALNFPTRTPTASWSGNIDTTGQSYIAARIAATFTRTDGEPTTPLVDFAFDYNLSPDFVAAMAAQGLTITGNDPNATSEIFIRGYEASTGTNSATFYIDVTNAVVGTALSNIALKLDVQALSTVEGTLTLERLI